jgi:Ras GTPase-activating-like protein IQGAP2/3
LTKLIGSAPESFGMVDQPIGQVERRNLAAVANLLTHVAAQDDPSSLKDRFVRVPLQEYIKSEGPIFRDWIMDGELNPIFMSHQLSGSGRC